MQSYLQINRLGDKEWRTKSGMLHRAGAPAVLYASGTIVWYNEGRIHRDDGPAITYTEGNHLWYVYGNAVYSYGTFQRETKCSDEIIVFLKLKYGEF